MSATIQCPCEYCNSDYEARGDEPQALRFALDSPLVAVINDRAMWTEKILTRRRFGSPIEPTSH